MKVLAISMGRKNHNCDIIAKQALMAAEKAGADVKFVNTMNMEISHCRGCGACSRSRDLGGQVRCILKDDYLALEKEVLDADGIILVAPVYSIAPTGQLVNFFGRFGAAHDLASATVEQEKREKEGKEPLDPRLFRKHYVAFVSVGGAKTENWTSMGLPNMYMFGMSTVMKTVGQINAYDMGRRTSPRGSGSILRNRSAKNLTKSAGTASLASVRSATISSSHRQGAARRLNVLYAAFTGSCRLRTGRLSRASRKNRRCGREIRLQGFMSTTTNCTT